MPRFNLNWLYIAIIAGLAFMLFQGNGESSINKTVSYTQFKEYVTKGYTQDITVNKTDGTARMVILPQHLRDVFKAGSERTGKHPTVTTNYPSADKVEDFLAASQYKGNVKYEETHNYWLSLLGSLLPIILLIAVWLFFMRRMGSGGGNNSTGIFSVGKSKARLFEKGSGLHVTFKDVAGQEGPKQEVQEIVDFLKNPKKYTDLGGKIPKGALLVGPPGTGKTLLAKAVAGEADVPFFSMSGSDFVEMFVGVGASRVRDLFRQAKEKAPCIIFIDEIDAVGRARGKNPAFGGNDERENTLNQLLTEMDGFGSNSGVIVLAATNRADILDKALMRAGRFDRQIHVTLPDLNERKEIFLVHTRNLKLAKDFDVEAIAKHTPGFSGADIANICNEAALGAARKGEAAISNKDFADAVDRVVGGIERKKTIMSPDEKRLTAYHEAGHAVAGWLLPGCDPVLKVSIIPRGQALGLTWSLPDEKVMMSKSDLIDDMCCLVGGRVAEEIINDGVPCTGALNDFERMTKIAYAMVTYYGMSEKVGNLSYYNAQGGYDLTKPYSEKTAQLIDEEAKAIVDEVTARTRKLLEDNWSGVVKLAEMLIEKEVIMADDIEAIFGPKAGKHGEERLKGDEPAAADGTQFVSDSTAEAPGAAGSGSSDEAGAGEENGDGNE